jgi:serine/threonine-protein kinase
MSVSAAVELQEKKLPEIPGYETLKYLGSGGMGTVYKARQIRTGHVVAVKLFNVHSVDDARKLRCFLRETLAALRITDPNIVRAYDVGLDNNILYYTMEWVDGTPIDRLIRKSGRLLEPLALDVARQVASALTALHERQVVHGDIKPSNIILTAKGVAKLCDLGLAHFMACDDNSTQPFVGTVGFVSPEQARRQAQLDGRSDLYSLGATLFAMLTGQAPYLSDSAAEIVRMHLTAPPPDPRPQASDSAAEIISKCMQKNAEHRYSSAAELRDRLSR